MGGLTSRYCSNPSLISGLQYTPRVKCAACHHPVLLSITKLSAIMWLQKKKTFFLWYPSYSISLLALYALSDVPLLFNSITLYVSLTCCRNAECCDPSMQQSMGIWSKNKWGDGYRHTHEMVCVCVWWVRRRWISIVFLGGGGDESGYALNSMQF